MEKESLARKRDWVSNAFNEEAFGAMEYLMGRLAQIMDATMRETWLPMGFRTRMVEEFPLLKELVVDDPGGLGALRKHVTHLRRVGDRYTGIARESEALTALRELEARLQALEADE
ncbi:hypothetical protein [Pelagicoccus mobilis]|uniref:Uncharacterized protein n=1 Tax=Pelagicoccus mobilis TaxID=415221 RepID=A0A934RY70_9BACT|nr:hypothetical protein [Pelagicoccus mobilis]MBK1878927.1 hypothetical protein [Pelagicoccus mobilis]